MDDQLVVGGLYSILSSSGKYKIVKILVLDEIGIHLKLYQNSFALRPREIKIKDLILGDFGEGISASHLPVTDELFIRCAPSFITKTQVLEDELEAYYIWRDNNGEYWNDIEL